MSKPIKVSEDTYQELVGLLMPRETFDGVIKRILQVYKTISNVSDILGPSHYLQRRPITDARAKETLDRRGDSPALPNVPIQ